jgi:hypothetical protein
MSETTKGIDALQLLLRSLDLEAPLEPLRPVSSIDEGHQGPAALGLNVVGAVRLIKSVHGLVADVPKRNPLA